LIPSFLPCSLYPFPSPLLSFNANPPCQLHPSRCFCTREKFPSTRLEARKSSPWNTPSC
jgi:hypothetical protein